MADYDGSIRIGVKMELENAQKQVAQLEKQFASQTKAVEKQAQAVERLKSQYDQLLSNTAMPEGARRLAENFASARSEAAKLDQQIQTLKAAETAGTISQEDAARLQELTEKMNEADFRADTLRQQLESMNVNEKAIDKMDRLAGSMGTAEARLQGLQQEAGATGGRLASAQDKVTELSEELKTIADSATVANEEIVALQKELKQLKTRKSDFESAGVGLGYQEYDQTLARIQEIKTALKEYETQVSNSVNTSSRKYIELSDSLLELQEKQNSLGLGFGNRDEYNKVAEDIKLVNQEMEQYRAELDKAAENGSLWGLANSAEIAERRVSELQGQLAALQKEQRKTGYGDEFDEISDQIEEVNRLLELYRSGLREGGGEENAAAGRLENLRAAMERLSGSIINGSRKSGSAVNGLRKNVSKLGREKGFSKAGNMAERLFNRIKRLVISAFFFRIIARQLRKLVQGLGKYMTANQEFTRALSGMKSNLLTAFQPIYDKIMPALASMMEGLEGVTAKLAAFIAVISGTTASKAQEGAEALYDEAIAAEEAGDAAEKARKQQEKFAASFDTIEKLGREDTEEESKTKPEFDTDFSEIQAPQWLLDFWKVFQDGWKQFGGPTMEAFRNAVQAIRDLIGALAEAFLAVWTGGTGLEFLGRVHALLQTIFGIVSDIAGAFKTAWDVKGEEVLNAFFYMLNSILGLVNSIGVSFREAWNDGYGVTICLTILDIFRNLFTIVGNLANRLREAWEANDNGVAIWKVVLGVVQVVLDTIKRITDATVEWSKDLDLEPLVSGVRRMLESLLPVVQIIGDTLAEMWETTVLPFLTWLLETALPGVLNALAGLFDYLSKHPELVRTLTHLVLSFISAWNLTDVIGSIMELASELDPVVIALRAIGTLVLLMIANFNKMNGLERFGAIFGTIALAIGAVCVVVAYLTGNLVAVAAAVAAITLGVASVGASIVSVTGRSASSPGGSGRSAARSVPTAYSAAALMDVYPHLANGAVIAPNHEFLAVLGDQRSGTNIETPLATMKQAFLEAIGESGLLSSVGTGGGDSQMILDGVTFARLIQPYLDGNQARIGVNLVMGG